MKNLLAALPVALLLACGGGAPKIVSIDLPKLGLKAEAPAETAVNDAPLSSGHMIMGTGLVVTVEEASDTRPKTIEESKTQAEMFNPKNVKDEKLADGWVVTYDNEGGMGKTFFVDVRRDIGGKAYFCTTALSEAAQRDNAVNFCKSLKK